MSDRFPFGSNWLTYLETVDESHVTEASGRLAELLGDLRGKSFLDVGCGSGIHSLAAIRLGASAVHSFDYDGQSVECSREMKRRFAPRSTWRIEQGSALDEGYLASLGTFDVVYSWGALHHTGDLWRALQLVRIPVGRCLAICLYDDQGMLSRAWRSLKRLYVAHPAARPAVILASLATLWGPKLVLLPHRVVPDWRNWKRKRGMSAWHDVVDWAGGYPFEFAKHQEVTRFFADRGLTLQTLRPFGRIIRMHEYVFSVAAQ